MSQIEETINIYEQLRKAKYRIDIENGISFEFKFQPENYHHLAGFQHLTDLPDICDPKSKHKFYSDLKNKKISEEKITSSSQYPEIAERIQTFENLQNILSPGAGKIIVDFDRTAINTIVTARYFLYKRDGAAFQGDVTYYNLFLGHNKDTDKYYPATYFVERSNLYMRDQELLYCEITVSSK